MGVWILCAALILQAVLQHLERRDLYNRLGATAPPKGKVPKRTVLPGYKKALDRWRGKMERKE